MADRFDYFFRQKVTETELDDGFAALENADRAQNVDLDLLGIASSAVVTEHSGVPDLTVDISSSSLVYDKLGERIAWGPTQTVDVSVDESAVSTAVTVPGNEKIVSVFAKFTRILTDPRIDGNSVTVYFNQAEGFEFVVRQGAEGAAPATPVALDATYILLADVRRSFGQTQILNSDITGPTGTYTAITDRREDMFKYSAGAFTVAVGTAEESDTALLALLNAHIIGPNAHAASSIDWAGGAAWLDGVTNPAATVEVQLDKIITDLSSQVATTSGANKLGVAARTAWLGGRTNPSTDTGAALDKVIVDLNDQTGGDDGAERIGAEAHTSAGTFGTIALGSVRTQLNDIIDLGVGVAVSNAMSNAIPFTFSQPTNTLQATAGDLILQTDSGSVIAKNTTAGGVEVENSTGDTVFSLSTAATTAPQTLVVGTGEGVATLAHGQQNVIEVQTGLNAPPGNVGRGLSIETGTSRNGASIAPYMMLRGGGLAGGSAGGPRGGFQWFWNVNEGNDERVSIMPCESQVVADGATQTLTIQHDLAPPACTPKLNASTTALVEIDLCCIGDNATSPTDNFGAFKRTALVRRNIAGNYAVVGSVQDTFSEHNFDESGSAMEVTIIASGASWPQIQVIQAGGLAPTDGLWWGTMRITVLQHTDVPDN